MLALAQAGGQREPPQRLEFVSLRAREDLPSLICGQSDHLTRLTPRRVNEIGDVDRYEAPTERLLKRPMQFLDTHVPNLGDPAVFTNPSWSGRVVDPRAEFPPALRSPAEGSRKRFDFSGCDHRLELFATEAQSPCDLAQ